jgi:hypothetical protein
LNRYWETRIPSAQSLSLAVVRTEGADGYQTLRTRLSNNCSMLTAIIRPEVAGIHGLTLWTYVYVKKNLPSQLSLSILIHN